MTNWSLQPSSRKPSPLQSALDVRTLTHQSPDEARAVILDHGDDWTLIDAEVVNAAAAHVRVLNAAEVYEELRVLMAEQGREVHVWLAVEGLPLIRGRPAIPGCRIDRVGWRA